MADQPVRCSLGGADLQKRLETIAELGAGSLVRRSITPDRHVLRFRSEAATRRRLEEIVAAEAECCSFLDLELSDEGGELVLSIRAPAEGRPVADELAAAFGGH
ncbi:MAG: hypothetical protein ACHQCF_05885 [Solirubrobacterales bacterium]